MGFSRKKIENQKIGYTCLFVKQNYEWFSTHTTSNFSICRYIYIITSFYGHPVEAMVVGLSRKKIENPKIGYTCFLFCDIMSGSVLTKPRTSLYISIYINNNSHFTATLLELWRRVFHTKR